MVITMVAVSVNVHADQTDPRLPGLFADLRHAPDEHAALEAERTITRLWQQAGDPDLTRRLDEARQLIENWSFDKAMTVLNTIVARAPQFAEAWNLRATLYYIRRDYEASRADVARTLALEPRHFGALAGLGEIRLKLGDRHGALSAFKRALAVHPYLPQANARVDALQ